MRSSEEALAHEPDRSAEPTANTCECASGALSPCAVCPLATTRLEQMRVHMTAPAVEAGAARDKITGDAAPSPTLFSIEELARRWAVNIKTIREAIRLGQVPVVRIGKRVVRIPRAAVEKLESHPQGCAALPGGRHGSAAR